MHDTDGLAQECCISSVLAMEIPQSCTKASKHDLTHVSSGAIWLSTCAIINISLASGLMLFRHQAITWTDVDLSLVIA